MMKTFALMLYVLNPQGESVFVIGYDMTMPECIDLRDDWETNLDDYSSVVCHPSF